MGQADSLSHAEDPTRTLPLQPRAAATATTAAAATSSQLLLLLPSALPLAASTSASPTSAPVMRVLALAPLPHPVRVVTRAVSPMLLPKPVPQGTVC